MKSISMNKKQKKNLLRIVVSAFLLLLSVILPENTGFFHYVKLVLIGAAYGICGYDILLKAWEGIRNGQVFGENFLMAVASIGALLLGNYLEGAAVMLFYQIGEWFESYAVGKSRKNIRELMDIRPDYANICKDDGTDERTDPETVKKGTLILIKPGEKIPLDGIVVSGEASLDTAALTGESLPRHVREGDPVFSGCISRNGLLKVKTTKEFGESTVSKVLEMVENASSRKSESETFISKFAKYYTPIVCFCALALALIPPLVFWILGKGLSFETWIYRALTFLVISCPCALVISIPLTFFAGIGGASREGILVKGSNYLEILSKTNGIMLDKTGTLTEGVFEVVRIYEGCLEKDEILRLAAYAESFSSHPIAESIKKAYGKELSANDISQVSEYSGMGVQAFVNGDRIDVGNRKMLERVGFIPEERETFGTLVHVLKNGEYAGCIEISDRIKEDAPEAVRLFRNNGMQRIGMLTGDRKAPAELIGKELGIDEVHAELMPQDKVEVMGKWMKDRKGKLIFVGDGLNDAPALGKADVGIAMGRLGTDFAIEAADVVLMDDNLTKVAKAIRIARKCMRIVYENIAFALAVKLTCLVLGALGITNMWMAIFADVGVMVIAVLNAVRALRTKNV